MQLPVPFSVLERELLERLLTHRHRSLIMGSPRLHCSRRDMGMEYEEPAREVGPRRVIDARDAGIRLYSHRRAQRLQLGDFLGG